MAEEYKYHLARWNERDKHLRCPGCGRGKGCFKEYVNSQGFPVDSVDHTVGKCDHEQSCGYHLTPSQWMKAGGVLNSDNLPKMPTKAVKAIEIDGSLVGQFFQHTRQVSNNFLRWVESLPLSDDQRACLPYLMQWYAIGTTSDGRIIWWQIDEERKVRTGKIMAYDNTGHRLKDEEGNSIGFSWVHSMLKKQGQFQDTDTYRWELMQCLFGQHLLPIFPDAEVHIVESEKTAFLMSIFDEYSFVSAKKGKAAHIWLAVGGLYNLKGSKLASMRHRTIYCYPDANGVDKWEEAISGTNAKLATTWMKCLKPEDGKGADIADVMLRMIANSKEARQQEADAAILDNPVVKMMVEKLNLVKA